LVCSFFSMACLKRITNYPGVFIDLYRVFLKIISALAFLDGH
jgi:hypothetical protein